MKKSLKPLKDRNLLITPRNLLHRPLVICQPLYMTPLDLEPSYKLYIFGNPRHNARCGKNPRFYIKYFSHENEQQTLTKNLSKSGGKLHT